MPVDMDHNEFRLMEDLVQPFKTFVNQLEAPQQRQIRNISFIKPAVGDGEKLDSVEETKQTVSSQGTQGAMPEETKQ